MAEFYRFPQWILTALVMIVALCIVLQTLTVSYSFRRLPAGWAYRAENGMECAVLAVLFLFAALLAQVQYGLYGDFLIPSAYCLARQAAFLLCAVLSAAAAAGTELIWPFFVIGGAAVLLPLTEAITGAAYPFFFLVALLYFLLRSIHICLIRRRELYTCISSISVKEAIDTLHTGLLFFRRSGDILLCNRRMDALARQLTGQPLRSGLEFQRYLENGELQDGCIREALGDQQVFRLPDASVWSIAAHAIPMGRRTCVLLTADDVTERWDAVTLLARQNEALEQRGRELAGRGTADGFCPQSSLSLAEGRYALSRPPPGAAAGDLSGLGCVGGGPGSAAGGRGSGRCLRGNRRGVRHQCRAPRLCHPRPVPPVPQ